MEPELTPGAIVIERLPEGHKIRLDLDLLNLDDLDTGHHQALVFQDPKDKRRVRGFYHVAVVELETQELARMGAAVRMMPDTLVARGARRALPGLVQTVNEMTDIKADFLGRITLDSRELFKVPFVALVGSVPFEPTRIEREQLGRYLQSGGFLFGDSAGLPLEPIDSLIRVSLESAGLAEGRHWSFVPLGDDHPLLSCCFDLVGPPLTYIRAMTLRYNLKGTDSTRAGILPVRTGGGFFQTHDVPFRGVEMNGHLAVLLTDWGYIRGWELLAIDPRALLGFVGGRFRHELSFAYSSRKFGVNLLVYALTQPGSITRLAVDTLVNRATTTALEAEAED
jgi:hypothetical protein